MFNCLGSERTSGKHPSDIILAETVAKRYEESKPGATEERGLGCEPMGSWFEGWGPTSHRRSLGRKVGEIVKLWFSHGGRLLHMKTEIGGICWNVTKSHNYNFHHVIKLILC